MWHEDHQVIVWRSKDNDAEVDVKIVRLEANAKKKNVIDDALVEVRAMYSRLTSFNDKRAFEEAVLRSLRKPPK